MPATGVPERVAVPLPLLVKLTPLGKVPVSLSVGVGMPFEVTVNVPAVPVVKVALLTLVIDGA